MTDPREQADCDVERGLRDLEASLVDAPEYLVTDDATGKRLIIPQRAMLAGMLEHLRRSYHKAHKEEVA